LPHKRLPPKEEIKAILDFAIVLMDTICKKFNIDLNEIKKL
jgi:hypothetical protein